MTNKKKDMQQELKESWQWVMKSNQGRRVIADILRVSGDVMHSSPFHGQTNLTIKNTGMQDVGRQIIMTVKTHCFDDWQKLEREEINNG